MIILMSQSPTNLKASRHLLNTSQRDEVLAYYPKIGFNKCQDTRISLIELDLQGNLQEQDGYVVAGVLQELGMPETITDIDIYASDISGNGKWLPSLAADMTNCLYDEYGREISVHIVSDINYSSTLLIPPSENTRNLWHVYGIKDQQRSLRTTKLNAISDKVLLWEGANLADWFNNSQRTFIPKQSNDATMNGVKIW